MVIDKCVHICLNGHVIQSSNRISKPEFCEKCGSQMIDSCPTCHKPIKIWYVSRGVVVFGKYSYERAAYCKECGSPYPWTQAAIEAATNLIYEEADLDKVQQEKLVASLPDIITDTPKTKIAVVRFKKALLAVGKFTAEGLRQFVIDFGCELAKSQLGF